MVSFDVTLPKGNVAMLLATVTVLLAICSSQSLTQPNRKRVDPSQIAPYAHTTCDQGFPCQIWREGLYWLNLGNPLDISISKPPLLGQTYDPTFAYMGMQGNALVEREMVNPGCNISEFGCCGTLPHGIDPTVSNPSDPAYYGQIYQILYVANATWQLVEFSTQLNPVGDDFANVTTLAWVGTFPEMPTFTVAVNFSLTNVTYSYVPVDIVNPIYINDSLIYTYYDNGIKFTIDMTGWHWVSENSTLYYGAAIYIERGAQAGSATFAFNSTYLLQEFYLIAQDWDLAVIVDRGTTIDGRPNLPFTHDSPSAIPIAAGYNWVSPLIPFTIDFCGNGWNRLVYDPALLAGLFGDPSQGSAPTALPNSPTAKSNKEAIIAVAVVIPIVLVGVTVVVMLALFTPVGPKLFNFNYQPFSKPAQGFSPSKP